MLRRTVIIMRLAAAFCVAASAVLHAAITEVGAIGLSVADLERQVAFYTEVLSFEKVTGTKIEGDAFERLHALPGVRARSATLRLGQETITLTEFERPRGAPIPADSRSFDHWFQHIAIVVSDMDAAYAQLRRHGVKHVSTSPQTLPAWNPDAGGIKAFYFRDPEDHVLEVIWFPPGKGDPRWQQPTDRLFLGIDHTAIVVRDTERSLAFYRDALGLVVAGGAENHGVEQERLNQVFGARLRITAVRAPRGPGIEFLEYLTPSGGRPLPPDARTVDLLAWTTQLRSDSPHTNVRSAETANGRRVSLAGEEMLARDPDGHLLLMTR
jgi:catechol 2,3-dioxygenase-like lactoylglutathione lyase family enzyme